MSSYALSERFNAQTILWATGSAIYQVAHCTRNVVELVVIIFHMMTFEVSWNPATAKAALKFIGCVAGLFAGLTLAILAPGLVVCVLVLVAFAAMSKP